MRSAVISAMVPNLSRALSAVAVPRRRPLGGGTFLGGGRRRVRRQGLGRRRLGLPDVASGLDHLLLDAVENGVGDQVAVGGDRPDGVVIAGYRIGDAGG